MSPERIQTVVDGRTLSLSNLDKVLYSKSGFTKSQVLDYYARVADVMIAHLRNRPATFKRFPNGVDGMSFYEKHSPAGAPEWVHTISVPSKDGSHEPIDYTEVRDRPTLLWAANLATLEFHVPLWRASKGKHLPTPPDEMVFDLDPGPGTTIVECCQVAQWIITRLKGEVFAKTSGSKGLQLYTHLSRRTWEKATEEAHDIARAVEQDHPELVVSVMRKELREKKVLIDWSQNNASKTTVAVYSLRAREDPTVSTPVTWAEVTNCAKRADPQLLRFEADDVLRRVDKLGDLMAALTSSKPSQALPQR
ncbi:MAG: non-homologous end-joining DNA ligase [Acidimicrobiales bacterium]